MDYAIGQEKSTELIRKLHEHLIQAKWEWCWDNRRRITKDQSIIIGTDRRGKIVGVMPSIFTDLLLDNWGGWQTAHISSASTVETASVSSGPMKDILGVDHSGVYVFLSTTPTTPNLAVGGYIDGGAPGFLGHSIQIGAGTTAPSHSDFTIQTAFGAGPEAVSVPLSPRTSGYGNSVISYVASIGPLSTGRTVGESVVLFRFGDRTAPGTYYNVVIARYTYGAGIVYGIGTNVTVTNTITI